MIWIDTENGIGRIPDNTMSSPILSEIQTRPLKYLIDEGFVTILATPLPNGYYTITLQSEFDPSGNTLRLKAAEFQLLAISNSQYLLRSAKNMAGI